MVLAAPTYRRFAVAPATLRRSRLPDHLSACSLRKPLLGISLPVAPVPRLSRRLQGAERSAFAQHIYFLLLLSDLDPYRTGSSAGRQQFCLKVGCPGVSSRRTGGIVLTGSIPF